MVRLSVEDRRALLVEAGTAVLLRDGIGAATTRAICAEANMPQSAFHYCFDSRTDLLRVIITDISRQMTIPTEDLLASLAPADGQTPEQYIQNVITQYVESIIAEPAGHTISLELVVSGRQDPDIAELARGFYEVYRETTRRILEATAARLEATWTVDLDILAIRMLSFVEGLKLSVLTSGNSEALVAAARSVAHDFATHLRPRS